MCWQQKSVQTLSEPLIYLLIGNSVQSDALNLLGMESFAPRIREAVANFELCSAAVASLGMCGRKSLGPAQDQLHQNVNICLYLHVLVTGALQGSHVVFSRNK